jgi:hypothetical protein
MTASHHPHLLSAAALTKLRTVSTATLTVQLNKRGFRNTFLMGLHIYAIIPVPLLDKEGLLVITLQVK